MSAATIFTNPKAFATPLLLSAFEMYGMDMFDWNPSILRVELTKQFPKIPFGNIDRLNAAIGLYTSDLFWTDPVVTGTICSVLNRERFDEQTVPDIKDLAWGIQEAGLIYSTGDTQADDESVQTFSPSVIRYIQEVMREAGVYTPIPSIPEVAAPEFTTVFDDPTLQGTVLLNSNDTVGEIEAHVMNNLIECLTQIKSLSLPLAKQASEQLDNVLQSLTHQSSTP